MGVGLDIPKPSGPSPILIILQVSSLRYNESSGNLKQEENSIVYIIQTHTTSPSPANISAVNDH